VLKASWQGDATDTAAGKLHIGSLVQNKGNPQAKTTISHSGTKRFASWKNTACVTVALFITPFTKKDGTE
jgi:hypothetical protein